MDHIPIIALYGESDSGKTALIEYLVEEGLSRSDKVATVKHSRKSPDLDRPGTDSWRHYNAGAGTVVISSPKKTISMARGERSLAEIRALLNQLGEWDLILAEGFKDEEVPKIAVGDSFSRENTIYRYEGDRGKLLEIVEREKELQTILSKLRGLDCGACGFETCRGLAEEIRSGKLTIENCRKLPKQTVDLTVNGKPVELNKFPADLITKALTGMVSALKGVEGDIESLNLEIDR